jgi:hypothetical protein
MNKHELTKKITEWIDENWQSLDQIEVKIWVRKQNTKEIRTEAYLDIKDTNLD